MNNTVLIVLLCVLVVAVGALYLFVNAEKFIKLPKSKKIEKIEEWLKYAVAYAESELGSNTGKLKLRKVYDMFLKQFPKIAKHVSFDTFSKWVDDALVWLNEQIQNNKDIKDLIENKLIK